ncbi:SDR family NAD(P)-dependent oxidoreductase [Alsobacter sp. SYSU M60028]|uniref:SDR family NAD(P)-dependent oxidoreductase n=1 Tax=Alsobacter ponti TaxID=2962936 RepID=A0ABT1LBS8_9HYPH|nr:SDR family NAD(P)-dependent oxidoreductase [Alsobacter ponti]MCP8938942.1 SDR family NAD(P)-dependent oxidoreductase [Alsobacter ponti]
MSGAPDSADGPVLVTGGAGFIGSNLADRLASDGRDVIVLDALARPGVEANLDWLLRRHGNRVRHVRADVRDRDAVDAAVGEACAVFHFAAQVAVTTSLVDPREDFDVNLGGTFNVIDALRRRDGRVPVVFASTNKVYGDLADIALERTDNAYVPVDPTLRDHGVSEARPLDFHTPYGCSKGAADQYVLDAARSFGIPSAVLRMSCIYGARQRGTEDQGWVAHFLIRALAGQPITIYGDGCQVRDVLEIGDCVDAYLACWARIEEVAGTAFNLGGGPENAVSLRQLVGRIDELVGRETAIVHADWRAGDQRYYVSDTGRAMDRLGLRRPLAWREGLERLAAWLEEERGGGGGGRPSVEAAE